MLRTLHRELDHVQAFDWEITALYDFVGRGGRIELSLSVDGSHVHQGEWFHVSLLRMKFIESRLGCRSRGYLPRLCLCLCLFLSFVEKGVGAGLVCASTRATSIRVRGFE